MAVMTPFVALHASEVASLVAWWVMESLIANMDASGLGSWIFRAGWWRVARAGSLELRLGAFARNLIVFDGEKGSREYLKIG